VHSLPFCGSHLASGLYFYRMQTNKFVGVGGMMLVR
jgi:hypothetical protein